MLPSIMFVPAWLLEHYRKNGKPVTDFLCAEKRIGTVSDNAVAFYNVLCEQPEVAHYQRCFGLNRQFPTPSECPYFSKTLAEYQNVIESWRAENETARIQFAIAYGLSSAVTASIERIQEFTNGGGLYVTLMDGASIPFGNEDVPVTDESLADGTAAQTGNVLVAVLGARENIDANDQDEFRLAGAVLSKYLPVRDISKHTRFVQSVFLCASAS